MPAAVAIPLIIGGAASLGGAAMASRASSKAAEAQQQAAEKAQRVNEQVWRDQQALFSPYSAAGQQSVSMLGRLTGVPEGATFAAAPMPGTESMFPSFQNGPQGAPVAPQGPSPSAPGASMAPPTFEPPMGAPSPSMPSPTMAPIGQRGPLDQTAPGGTMTLPGQPLPPPAGPDWRTGRPSLASMAPQRSAVPASSTDAGTMAPRQAQQPAGPVELKAPDGSALSVPAEQVQSFLSRGYLRR